MSVCFVSAFALLTYNHLFFNLKYPYLINSNNFLGVISAFYSISPFFGTSGKLVLQVYLKGDFLRKRFVFSHEVIADTGMMKSTLLSLWLLNVCQQKLPSLTNT